MWLRNQSDQADLLGVSFPEFLALASAALRVGGAVYVQVTPVRGTMLKRLQHAVISEQDQFIHANFLNVT